MDAARWRRIETLFTEALSKPPLARGAYLTDACPDDDSMRAEIESLLEAHHGSGAFLERLTRSEAGGRGTGDIPVILPGTRLGVFEIVAPLGSGGMGAVYHARDTRLGRSVALKVLTRPVDRAESSSAQFEREARAISRLSHPHICTLYDVARAPLPPDGREVEFLVMEIVRGETLAGVIARGPLSIDDALQNAIEIADALSHAHGEGIVHRDLKPRNVMITPDGVKLLDFGLATFTATVAPDTPPMRPPLGTIAGTAQYMAPEQILGGDVDGRTDVFSLGIVLHEMLSGTRVFERSTLLETLHAILNDTPAPLDDTLPPALRDAVARCLEKDPDARFQSAAALAASLRAIVSERARDHDERGLLGRGTLKRVGPSRRVRWAALAVLALAVAAGWSSRKPPALAVSRYVRLSNDGQQKAGALATDGSRLYVTEFVDREPVLVQVPTSGGDTTPVPVPFRNPGLDDISPQGSDLFVADANGPMPFQYWLISPDGVPARKLGSFRAVDVHPSPDGRYIVYVTNEELFVSRHDGTAARKIASLKGGNPGNAVWAPDGRRIRFTLFDFRAGETSIWEVATDGSGLRPLLPGWRTPPSECCGRWTSDGAYYVFQATEQQVTNLWAIREKRWPWEEGPAVPTKLTNGPMQFRSPLPARESRTIYAIGDEVRGEIMRRDQGSGEWTPWALGSKVRSMSEVTFSPDGSRVAYVGYPDAMLWTSKADGTEDRQLTFAPMSVNGVSWAPDGTRLAFSGRRTGQRWKIYLIPVTGGTPERLTRGDESEAAPEWSPDGTRIVFGGSPFFEPGSNGPTMLRSIDLGTRRVTDIAGSEGVWAARWSPDGRYLVAHRFDFAELRLLEVATGRWEQLAKGVLHFANWSRDSQFVFFESWGDDIAVIRIRIQDRRRDSVGALKQFRRTIGPERCWSGLTPDNSLLVLRDVGSQEVYELSLNEGGP